MRTTRRPVRLSLEVLDERVLFSANPIVQENLLPGNPPTEWDVSGAGDDSIQGFATDISVDQGQTIQFKVNTVATDYRLDIYRMGYYQGLGARKVATIQPSAALPQIQPDPLVDDSGLVDAGNWAVSASWAVPQNATSGIYFAKLVREDGTPGASQIFFVVRDDDGQSDLLFQTSDSTWQAYNTWGSQWGGGSLYNYETNQPLKTPKVSYNRPITDRNVQGGMGETNFVFWAEYPMVRFLESNGYNVSYFTNVDTARFGGEIMEHKAFLSVGHDEYWSREMRDNVEAARDAGVNLAFFSGNEMFWKTRWETSIDGSGTPYRTLVCYKESRDNAKTDPLPNVWTGMWRDQRFLPLETEPEQTLIGQIFSVNRGAIFPGTSMQVPAEDGKMRFWRNTAVATQQPGDVAVVGDKVLGYEWDEDVDNGFRPTGVFRMSSTTEAVAEKLVDPISWPGCGGTPGVPCSLCRGCMVAPGIATHTLTQYRAPSGAIVFGAGTVQWSWGLDGTHDGGATVPSVPMRQATVNLFADMGVQPGSLQADLTPATATTDTTPPSSTITSPAAGIIVQSGSTPITITGTAADAGGGVVGGVEISTDGGQTWHRAEGRSTWSYVWTPSGNGQVTLKSRAADDSGRIETPGPGVTVTVLPDNTTPPQITGISSSAVTNQSVLISWATDEGATSRVRYGTNPANLSGDSQDTTLVQAHGLTLTNLTPNTTYYYQVSSTDEFNNTSTTATLTFTTPAFLDTTEADFALGTLVNTVIAGTGNGEVTLVPAARAEFSGTSLPTGWSATIYATGGSAAVASGKVSINGARVSADALFGPGRSLEFSAVFTGAAFQNIGLGTDFNSPPWAMFSTGSMGNQLMVRTRAAGAPTSTDTVIPGTWLNAPHVFRIDWISTGITYFIDGTQVALHPLALTASMRPIASDLSVDSQAVTVDWMRLSPYGSSGSYSSRVLDAGSSVRWIASWNASAPTGTGLELSLRMGNSATPDASWTDFIPVTSGAATGGKSRYVQYRVGLTSSNPALTPALPEVSLSYTTAPDNVAPSIAARTPAPGATNVDPLSGVIIAFDELMNPATINSSTVRLRALDGTQDVPATVSYAGSTATLTPATGLSGNRAYRVTVAGTVTDSSGNSLGTDQTWTFTTGPRQIVDTTTNDFSAGSTASGTYLTQTGNGEVTLSPVVATEFSGNLIPTGWTATPWGASGTAVVANGVITLDGSRVWTSNTFGVGRTLEFVATFTGAPYQHIGITNDFSGAPWAIFSTGPGGGLLARTNGGAGSTDTQLAGNWLNAPHRFRIDWTSTGVTYSIDGTQVASHAVVVTGTLRPAASDLAEGGDSLVVDWMRVSPFTSAGTFQSRVFDAGQVVGWNVATWNTTTPVGTSVALGVRMGNTPTPDASWTNLIPVNGSGAVIGGSSRYLQYQAMLASPSGADTPALNDVTITYNIPPGPGDPPSSPDTVAPRVISRTPTPDAVEVDPVAPVLVSFSELMNAATITTASVRLREQGASSDVPATVTFLGSTATLTPSAPLAGNRTYQVTITTAVTDLAGNPLAAADTWTFTTKVPTFRDTTAADFGGGTLTGTYLASAGDGELTLSPSLAAEFAGSTLPAGWSSTPWASGGSSTVAGGLVAVDGALLQSPTTASAGQSLEFVATFGGAGYQHTGFADFAGGRWAMFSTGAGGALYARSNGAGGSTDTLLPGNWLNAPHRFRIDWNAAGIAYSIDGTQVASHSGVPSGTLPVIASDAAVDGNAVSLDWVRLSPYLSSGTFTSRVFDAGQAVTWGALSWTAVTPATTSLALSYRVGNTATPDATWTDFIPTSSGAPVGGSSRYFQYQAGLATVAGTRTPSLNDVTVAYSSDPDTSPPAIVARTPAAGATGRSIFSGVTVTFSELMNVATINASTITLRPQGGSVDVPATVSYTGSTATLTPSAPLAGNTSYVVTVSGSVADAAGNLIGNGLGMLSWSFTTGPGQYTQTTAGDFGTGTISGTDVTDFAGGEVQLGAVFADAFGGSSLNAGNWTTQTYTTPSVTVSGGQVSVSGAALWSTQALADAPAEGRVSFGASPYQYFGLATSLDAFAGNYWAAFSTGGSTDNLLARVNVSGTTYEVNLGALPVGFHNYQVAPGAGGFGFYVDGTLRTTVAASFPVGTATKLVLSFYNAAPQPAAQADWLRFDRFTPSGTYTSAILDARTLANWSRMDWTSSVPTGTALSIEARTADALGAGSEKLVVLGTDQVLDGYGSSNWSAWTPVSNGGDLTSSLADSRYVQYRVLLSTTDPSVSAALADLAFTWM